MGNDYIDAQLAGRRFGAAHCEREFGSCPYSILNLVDERQVLKMKKRRRK